MNSSSKDALTDLRNRIAEIEGASFFSASSETVNFEQLSSAGPDQASEDDLVELLEKAKKKIERLCAVRERCTSEMAQRLQRDGFPESVSHEAIAWAVRCGFIDDARFAEVFVRSRLAAGKGTAGISRELTSLGIDPQTVELLADYEVLGHDNEVLRALDLLRRKPPRAKNARDAAYRRLIQKGFSSDVASSAAREWVESL